MTKRFYLVSIGLLVVVLGISYFLFGEDVTTVQAVPTQQAPSDDDSNFKLH